MNNPNEPYNNDQNNSYVDDYLNNTVDIPTQSQSQSQHDQYGSQYPQAHKNTPNKTLIICLGIIGVTIVIILTALIVFALTGRSSGGNAGSSESGFVTGMDGQQAAAPTATPIPTPRFSSGPVVRICSLVQHHRRKHDVRIERQAQHILQERTV